MNIELTPREREVLDMLADGIPNREIGDILNCSEHTIRTHCVNIYGKLQVESATQAAVYVWKQRTSVFESELATLREQFAEAKQELRALEFYLRKAVQTLTKMEEVG